MHHAERAGDDETLAEVAPEAARSAATSSAHREAAAHYRRALRLAHRYPAATQATLLESYTIEASVTCQLDDAMQAAKRALALREQQADPTGVGHNLRWISWLAWLAGRREEMDQRLDAALEVLEDQPPGPDLAMACAALAVRIGLYGGRREDAERTAQRAVALARDSGDPAVVCHVATQVGILPAALRGDDTQLRRGLALAREGGRHMEAGIAYQALSGMAMLSRARPVATKWITEGIAYLEARQIEAPLRYLQGLHALLPVRRRRMGRGRGGGRPSARPTRSVRHHTNLRAAHARPPADPPRPTRRGLRDPADPVDGRRDLRTSPTHRPGSGRARRARRAARRRGNGHRTVAVGPPTGHRVGATPLVAELGFWLDRLGEASGPLSSDPTDPYRVVAGRRLAGGRRDLGGPGLPLRAGPNLGRGRRRGRARHGPGNRRPARRRPIGRPGARAAAHAGRGGAPRAARRHPREPRRAHRTASRSARPSSPKA